MDRTTPRGTPMASCANCSARRESQIYCIGIVEMGGAAGGTLDMQGQAISRGDCPGHWRERPSFRARRPNLRMRQPASRCELRHQYSIGYAPTNVSRDGQWHKIKVGQSLRAGCQALKVQHREGYHAISRKVRAVELFTPRRARRTELGSVRSVASPPRRRISLPSSSFSLSFLRGRPFFSLPKLADRLVLRVGWLSAVRSRSWVMRSAP
jgi:hypothetical protein